jgi:hypothetical protein
MSDMTYCGPKRLVRRRRFLRSTILVLQVLVEEGWNEWRGTALHTGCRTRWKDATPEDLEALTCIGRGVVNCWSEIQVA